MSESSVDQSENRDQWSPTSVTPGPFPTVGLNRRFSFEAETLLYTLSEGNIARSIKDDLESDISTDKDGREGEAASGISVKCSKEDGDRRAPDGGYGWFVTLGSFMSCMVEGGFERGEGMFYLHFIERYGMSHQITTIPSSMASTLRFLLAPLASTVCNRYSIRTSTIIGATVFTAGVFLTQYSYNFFVLFLTYGLLGGIGRAFFSGPGLIIIGLYFRKRQGVASGIATSGVGFGSFILVPLIEFLFDCFGYEGAFLVLSGVAAQMIIVAMLYRPLSKNNYYLRMDAKRRLRQSGAKAQQEKSASGQPSESTDFTPNLGPVFAQSSPVSPSVSAERISVTTEPAVGDRGSQPPEGARCGKCRSLVCDNCCCQIFFPTETFNMNQDTDSDQSRMFHCYLLKHKPFSLYCIAVFLFTASFKVVCIFFPTLVLSKGHSTHDAAVIVSLAGPIDTFSRICIGLLVDLHCVRPYRMRLFNILLVALAASSIVLPHPSTLPTISVALTIYSTCAGMCFATRTVVLVDLLGVRRLSSAFGLLMFFQGFAVLFGPPFGGWVLDRFGSVYYPYYWAGAVMALAAVFMNCSIVWHERLQDHLD